jgi:hypothetical protein
MFKRLALSRSALSRSALARLSGGIVAAGLLASAAFVSAGSAPAHASDCPGGSWTDTVGRPAEVQPGMTGVALWRSDDNNIFRLRVSEAGGDVAGFRGTISTDGAIVFGRRHLEHGDLTISRSDGRVSFFFVNRGGVDGLDFAVRCASYVKLGVRMNGTPVPVEQIVIGADSAHPATNPFVHSKAATA